MYFFAFNVSLTGPVVTKRLVFYFTSSSTACLLMCASPLADSRCPITDTKLHWQLLSERWGECLVRVIVPILSLLSFENKLPLAKSKSQSFAPYDCLVKSGLKPCACLARVREVNLDLAFNIGVDGF